MTDRARAEPRRLPSRRRGIFRTVAVLALAAAIALLAGCSADRQAVRVGAKDFTEQKVLAEMVAQLLETGGVPVSRIVQFPNGVTPLDAIGEGVVDAYVEYTGTALLALGLPSLNDSAAALDRVVEESEPLGLEWLAPLGFSNDYVLAVTPETAARFDLSTISDLAGLAVPPRIGVDREFLRRPAEGLGALTDRYGLVLNPEVLVTDDKAELYRALRSGEVDVVEGFATDAQIRSFDLVALEDDLGFLPAYDAAVLVRGDVLARYPRIAGLVEQLQDRLSADDVRNMIIQVQFEGRDAKVVASAELARLGLLEVTNAQRGNAVVVAIGLDDQRAGATGRALEAINEAYPGRPIDIVAVNDPAGAVLAGEARLGIANAEDLFAPGDRTDGDRPTKPLEAIAAVETRAAHLLAPADGEFDRTLAVGPPGSSSRATALTLIEQGVLPAGTRLVTVPGEGLIGERVAAVRSGTASAMLAISPPGHPEIQQAISDFGLRLFSLPGAADEERLREVPHLRPARIPAAKYRGQPSPVDTVSQQTVIAGPASDVGQPGVYGPNAFIGGPAQPVSASAVGAIRDLLETPRVDPALPRSPAPLTDLDQIPKSTNPSALESALNFLVIAGMVALVAFILRRRRT